MLSQELEFCLNDAFAKAREARHEFLTVEHLLLSILDTPKVREILRPAARTSTGSRTRSTSISTTRRRDCPATRTAKCSRRSGFQRVLQRAVFHVQSSGKKEVGVANVLIAIFSEKQSHAVHLLNRARRHAPRCREFRLARPLEDRRGEDREGRRPRPRASATAKAAARSTSTRPTSTSRRRTARSIR